MPRGIPKKKSEVIVIDAIPDPPTRYSPALGAVDRLLNRSALETQSLRIVRDMLVRDQGITAAANGHAKLLQAANMRKALPDIEHHNGTGRRGKKRGPYKKKNKHTTINKAGVIKNFIAEEYIAATRAIPTGTQKTKAEIARQLQAIAKERGIKTTFGSLAQGVYVHERQMNAATH